jgi:hypothetical protein
MFEKEEGTCMMKYILTARVQLPPSFYSSKSTTSNEELSFKKCEKSTIYCRTGSKNHHTHACLPFSPEISIS